MDFDKLLEKLLPILGQKVIDKITDELDGVIDKSKGWQKSVLALAADAIEKFGPEGIVMAINVVKDLKKNKVPDMPWANLRVSSDILAQLQNAEADKKTAAHDFLVKISNVFGLILGGLFKLI